MYARSLHRFVGIRFRCDVDSARPLPSALCVAATIRRMGGRSNLGLNGLAQLAERLVLLTLIVCGTALILIPLLLTVYLSLFDEKLILFPPRGYTLAWYAAIGPNFGKSVITSLKLG